MNKSPAGGENVKNWDIFYSYMSDKTNIIFFQNNNN